MAGSAADCVDLVSEEEEPNFDEDFGDAGDDDDDEVQLADVVIRNGPVIDARNLAVKAEKREEDNDEVKMEAISWPLQPHEAAQFEAIAASSQTAEDKNMAEKEGGFSANDVTTDNDDDVIEIVAEDPGVKEEDISIEENDLEEAFDDDDDDDEDDGDVTKLFVNHLPQLVRDEDLLKMFNFAGPIERCQVMRDEATDSPRGWGLVEFASAADAKRAMRKMDGRKWGRKVLRVRPFVEGVEGGGRVMVTCQNSQVLPGSDLAAVFAEFGPILDVVTLDHGKVAFVKFKLKASADAAIQKMQGLTLQGHRVKVFRPDIGQKVKFQYYADYVNKQEDNAVYQRLKQKGLLPKDFKANVGGLSVKNRLGSHSLYNKLKNKRIIAANNGGKGGSVKDRLGPKVTTTFKNTAKFSPSGKANHPKSTAGGGSSGRKQQNNASQRSGSVERLVRDQNGKIVPIRSDFRKRTSSF